MSSQQAQPFQEYCRIQIQLDDRRVMSTCLQSLQKCNLNKARKLIADGGRLRVHLDQNSTKRDPIWRITIQDQNGQHWVLIGIKTDQPRQLTSVQLVYQVARNIGMKSIDIPVDY